jgi:hypothetical protein
MRKCGFILAGALALVWAGCRTRPAAASEPTPHPYTRVANPDAQTVQLQIALRKFAPAHGSGPTIWLASVMHVGEQDYYHALQRFLDTQTVVLYEGINTEAHPHHVRKVALDDEPAQHSAPTAAGAKGGYSMQSTLARSLGLVFQLEAIDYDRDNFLNSDLSVAQIERIMAGNRPVGPPGQKSSGNGSFDTLMQIMDGSSFLGSLFKMGLEIIATSPKLQAVAKLTMIEAIGQLKGDMSDVQGLPPDWKQLIKVLIQARNKNLLADLEVEMKRVPRSGSIAVFYGAAHMDDLEKHVTGELHYRPVEERWLTAISVDMRRSGISPVEAQFLRGLIQGQVKEMKSP